MAFSFENHPLYPYLSEFTVRDFVLDKLSESNYEEWKKLMLDFIESPGLVGFIDGTVGAPPFAPPEMVTVPVPNAGGGGASSSSRCHQIIEIEEKYRSWKRSDGLVRGWILTTLTKDILTRVLPFKTAEEVWTELEAMFHAATRIPTFDVPMELENIAKPHSGGDIKNPIDCLIYESCPPMINLSNAKKQNIFQYAIACCRENVFNLVYQLEESSYLVLSLLDALGNNALHLAALLGPQQQLSLRVSAAGAALQMQRKLQWFKEVEKLVLPRDKEERNTNGMAPAEVFTDTHQELVKEGERWMNDTATSCTIVAALIVNMVFAAAITVPGGNNNNDGHPYFSKHKAFIIFGIFDALALFSSIASVLMFLSILTARYAEEDFLYALPKRLIIGLVMLFVSILSTMIAFGATLYLMFGDNKVWILVPVVGFSCILVTLFAALQFPLFVQGEEISFRV